MIPDVKPAPEPPRPDTEPHLVDIAGGERLAEEPLTEVVPVPAAAPPPGPVYAPAVRRRVRPRVRVPSRVRAVRVTGPADGGYARAAPTETPADVQLVVILLAVAMIAVAIIIGMLVSSALVGIIVAVIGLGALFSTVWFSRR